jgi:hypothetical protein
MGFLEKIRRRRLVEREEYPKDSVILGHYLREYGPIEDVGLVTFNRPYNFSFSGVTFARTVIEGYVGGNYQISYAWKDPAKVTVTRGYFGDISVFVGEL